MQLGPAMHGRLPQCVGFYINVKFKMCSETDDAPSLPFLYFFFFFVLEEKESALSVSLH